MQLTVRDAAKLLGMAERRLYGLIDDGEIPFYRVNDQYRFNQTELLEWAMTRRLPISGELVVDADARLQGPGLADALEVGGIVYDVPACDRDSALREVVLRMPLASDADREMLYGILLAREACGSTAVGDGIAIPHVRSPIVSGSSSGSVTLCMLSQAVDFGAADKLPVHTLFSIVSPTIEVHLRLLGKVASALHDREFRAAVLARKPVAEILQCARRLDADKHA